MRRSSTTLHTLFVTIRRVTNLVVLCLICLPGASASANLLWGQMPEICPIDAAPQSQRLAPISSESLATLKQWLVQESMASEADLASGAISPCGAEENSEITKNLGVCINTKAKSPWQAKQVKEETDEIPETPQFIAASLTEDLTPLAPPAPSGSCSLDSENPQRCEAYPGVPVKLHLDATLSHGQVASPLPLSHPVRRIHTLKLVKAFAWRLIGPSRGHPDAIDEPPQFTH